MEVHYTIGHQKNMKYMHRASIPGDGFRCLHWASLRNDADPIKRLVGRQDEGFRQT